MITFTVSPMKYQGMTLERGFERKVDELINKRLPNKKKMTEIADDVLYDIVRGIKMGIDLNSNKFVPNTEKTIKRKGHGTVLVDTGKMFGSIKHGGIKGTDANLSVEFSVKGGGTYWQTKPKNEKFRRDFFGVSKRMLNRIKIILLGK